MKNKAIILAFPNHLERYGTYIGPYMKHGKQIDDLHVVFITEEATPKGKRKKLKEPYDYLAHEEHMKCHD